MKVRGLTEGALFAALTIILALVGYYVPFLTIIIYVILPIPTIIMYKRFGLVYAFLESVTASLLLFLFIDPINSMIISSNIVVPGILFGYSYSANKTGGVRILFGYIGSAVALVFELILTQMITGTPIVEEFTNEINTMVESAISTYQSAGLLEGDNGATLLSSINQLKETMLMLLPSMFLVLPLLISYCSVLFTDLIFSRLRIKFQPVQPLTQWRLPDSAKSILAITTVIVFIANYFLEDSPYYIYTYTIELLIMALFTLLGYGFIFWFLSYRFKKKLVFVRILILVLTFMFSGLLNIVSLVGIFDTYFDLRRFITNRFKGQ